MCGPGDVCPTVASAGLVLLVQVPERYSQDATGPVVYVASYSSVAQRAFGEWWTVE